MAKNQFYTVWIGRETGIFSTWEQTEQRTKGFPGAKFKGFPTLIAAAQALEQGWEPFYAPKPKPIQAPTTETTLEPIPNSTVEAEAYYDPNDPPF